MTMIWNCTLQKCALTENIFFSSNFPLKLSAAPCSTLSLYVSVYGGKNVIANSNMTVSLSQVSLTETEEIKSREIVKKKFEVCLKLWCYVKFSSLPTTSTR